MKIYAAFATFIITLSAAFFGIAEQATRVDAIALNGRVDNASAHAVINGIHRANRAWTSDPIYLYINSGGGEISAGGEIVDAIAASRRPVYTVVTGMAMSMGAEIWNHGAHRYMFPHAMLMYHEAARSDGKEMEPHEAEALRKTVSPYDFRLHEITGLAYDEISRRRHDTWWVFPAEAIKAHLADSVIRVTDYPAP